MDEPKPLKLGPQRELLEIDPSRLRLLRAIVEYVKDVRRNIDPDRFRIDEARLGAMLGQLGAQNLDTLRISVTYQDILFLEMMIDAAATYSQRREFHSLDEVDHEDFSELLSWLAREENHLFRQPPTIH
jgi:hypothetical protein